MYVDANLRDGGEGGGTEEFIKTDKPGNMVKTKTKDLSG